MKHFRGTIRRLNALKYASLRKLLDLKAQIRNATNRPYAEIEARKQYSGAWIIRKGFSATMRPIRILYRHLCAKARVVMGHRAKVSAAQAAEANAKSTVQTATETPLSCASANSMQIRRKERVSVLAGLVAYRRAGLAYFRRMYFGVKAALATAPGKTAPAFRERFGVKKTASADTASGTIVESNTMIETATEARGSAVQAASVPGVSVGLKAQHTAQPGKAAVIGANIDNAFRASHSAKMATWIAPEVVDGVLILRQAYSATMENDVLVVI